MTLHVAFTKEGLPGWIGTTPCAGSEPVEGVTIEFLAAHRRTETGKWVARAQPVAIEPSPEEIAAQRDADYLAALAARDEALRLALAAEADPQFFLWQRSMATKEDWLATVAQVKARFPKPDRL